MPLFVYSNIEFNLDLSDPEAKSIPLGLIAEWCTDDFWKVAICARINLLPIEVEQLSNTAKEVLENPFGLLYETTHQYLEKIGTRQCDHIMEKYLIKTFPTNLSIQAPSLYQYAISPDENPEELFEELCLSVPGPTRKGIWFRIPSQAILLDAEAHT